uniref:VWFA domain-containing protein n=1 Tax=Strigamia maritima TaxID=126957 RepID=T1ILD1_STRMM
MMFQVKLENNAYKGIVIAIDDDIQQSNQQENIIEAIKDMFTSGSSFLYKATGKRAYFGEVTILLPKHWNLSRPDIENAGIESYDSADIRVTFPNKGRPNNMSFTMYQEECGKGGKFIHMNLGHLLKQEPELISRTWYGDPGMTKYQTRTFGTEMAGIFGLVWTFIKSAPELSDGLALAEVIGGHSLMAPSVRLWPIYATVFFRWLVKHWAMYRYGIYEEHGLIGFDKFRTFYDINNSYEPTGCANERLIQGTQYNFLNASSECEIDEGEERPSKYCYYASIGRVGEEGDITSSSIAFDHTNSNASRTKQIIKRYIVFFCAQIQKFCGVDETNKHQEGPPTPHNHYCKNRSTWSVIMEHDDFQNKNKPRDIKVTKPNFRFVRPNLPHRFVMVIDTSASMNNKHLQMINMAFKSVMYNLPFNSTFGLVAFNETARVLYGLETIIQFEDKEKIIGSFPTVGRGSTCIACGLEKAIEMIKNYDSSNSKACRGTKIILLTDGNENEVKRIENIIDELRKESVRIFPIAYGNYADDHLEELSKETNGIT